MAKTSHRTHIHFFREAAPYIQAHKGKTFVIAISSEIIDSIYFKNLINDIAVLSSLGVKIVLVHGTRLQMDQQIADQNITSVFHKGLRVSSPEILEISKNVVGRVRVNIESMLSYALNRPPVINRSLAIVSGSFITAKPIGIHNGIDYEYTGKVRKISKGQMQQQLDNQNIILLSPLGLSPTGKSYNLHYEEVATQAANALHADKLLFLINVPDNLPRQLTLKEARKHSAISPFIQRIDSALTAGVSRVHLIDADNDGGLLLELYTRDGLGTLISNDHYEEVTQANIEDISGILDLIRPLEVNGTLIKRSREQLELEVDNFIVIRRDQKVIACAALYRMTSAKVGELACLVVDSCYRSQGKGDILLHFAEEQAKQYSLDQLLVLTTQTTDWFQERGFIIGDIDDLPDEKKKLYNYQRGSKILLKPISA